MTGFSNLPLELFEKILLCDNLQARDIVSFASTCTFFRHWIHASDSLWRALYRRHWPITAALFADQHLSSAVAVHPTGVAATLQSPRGDLAWMAQYASHLRIERKIACGQIGLSETTRWDLRPARSVLGSIGIDVDDAIALSMWQESADHFASRDVSCHFAGVNRGPGALGAPDCTARLRLIIGHYRLACQWLSLLSRPAWDVPIEEGAILVAQVVHPCLSRSAILQQLDAIADAARPQVLAANTPRERVEALNVFFFCTLSFRGNVTNYYHLDNSCIDKVLETRMGLPITLSIIYVAVANRLSLPAQIVNYPGHVLARVYVGGNAAPAISSTNDAPAQTYMHTPQAPDGAPPGDFVVVDSFRQGRPNISPHDVADYAPTSPRFIYDRMLRNINNLYMSEDIANGLDNDVRSAFLRLSAGIFD